MMVLDDVLPVLKTNEFLQKVPEDQLTWLVDNSTLVCLEPGDFLFRKDEPTEHMYIVLEGRIRLYIGAAGSQREIGVMEPGDITGVLPYSRLKTSAGYGSAIDAGTCILHTHKDKFPEMIRTQYELVEALVHVMTSRVREFTALRLQNEKMMALGKMSAGLSHELNNPAAAIVRASDALKKNLRQTPESFKKMMSMKLLPEQINAVNDALFNNISCGCSEMSLMQKSNLEDELVDWMLDKGIEDPYDMASNLVEYEFDIEDMEMILKYVGPDNLEGVISWIVSNIITEKLVEDIGMASDRISALVNSVKSYTHMDRGSEKQEVDIHTGIRNTLTLLNHKVKKANIKIVENFQEDLPKAKIYVSEMNQVWTNLIDNAIDAMEPQGNGILEIATLRDRQFIKVKIIDSGPGIPEEIQSRIFDPFFTTKEVGKGTGLGLDVAHKIVEQHHGTITLDSRPGRTEFLVCFPVDIESL